MIRVVNDVDEVIEFTVDNMKFCAELMIYNLYQIKEKIKIKLFL